MSKPMKPKTTGLSAGPTAYWDARSDAAKDAEIKRLRELVEAVREDRNQLFTENKRLRELVEAGKEDRKAIDELVDENLRLRGLLKDVVGDVVQAADWGRLMEEITKEVGK